MVRSKRIPYTKPKKPGKEVATTDGEVKKKRKLRPGTKALREIRQFQSRTDQLVPRAVIERLVREIAQECLSGTRFAGEAIEALHEAGEAYMVELLTDANSVSVKSGLVTLMPRHLDTVLELRKK